MPLFKEYRKQLDSRVADIVNSSQKRYLSSRFSDFSMFSCFAYFYGLACLSYFIVRSGGACVAAIFLKEFVETERYSD